MTDTGLDHPTAMKFHALRRFQERCGITLAPIEYDRMCEAIRRDNLPPVAFTKENLRFFKVRVRGVTAYALWKRGQIVTFYPSMEWVKAVGGREAQGAAA